MNLKSYFICLALLFMGIISCTKTVTKTVTVTVTDTVATPPTYSIEGMWIGTYLATTIPTQPAYYFSYNIQPGGRILVQGQTSSDSTYATGSWVLSGDTLRCSYTFFPSKITQNSTSIFSNTGTLSSGTWEDPFNSGTFSMTRIE